MVACLTQTVKLTATDTTQSYRDGEASKGSKYSDTKKNNVQSLEIFWRRHGWGKSILSDM